MEDKDVIKWHISYVDEDNQSCSCIAYNDHKLVSLVDMLLGLLVIGNIKSLIIEKADQKKGILWN